MRARKKHTDLKGCYPNTARHKTSIEVIDFGDRDAEVLMPEFPTYLHIRKGK